MEYQTVSHRKTFYFIIIFRARPSTEGKLAGWFSWSSVSGGPWREFYLAPTGGQGLWCTWPHLVITTAGLAEPWILESCLLVIVHQGRGFLLDCGLSSPCLFARMDWAGPLSRLVRPCCSLLLHLLNCVLEHSLEGLSREQSFSWFCS